MRRIQEGYSVNYCLQMLGLYILVKGFRRLINGGAYGDL